MTTRVYLDIYVGSWNITLLYNEKMAILPSTYLLHVGMRISTQLSINIYLLNVLII